MIEKVLFAVYIDIYIYIRYFDAIQILNDVRHYVGSKLGRRIKRIYKMNVVNLSEIN